MTWPPSSRGAGSNQDAGINVASEAKTPFFTKGERFPERGPTWAGPAGTSRDQAGTSRTSRDHQRRLVGVRAASQLMSD